MTTGQPIFVFGSNLAGRHGKGAALFARQQRGAIYGVGVGRTGNSYALPTKDSQLRTLPLEAIEAHVMEFLAYARRNPGLRFEVTRIGCGLAGYRESDVAPMFRAAPDNCDLPAGWRDFTAAIAAPVASEPVGPAVDHVRARQHRG